MEPTTSEKYPHGQKNDIKDKLTPNYTAETGGEAISVEINSILRKIEKCHREMAYMPVNCKDHLDRRNYLLELTGQYYTELRKLKGTER